jgi:hypothetical protein
MRRGISLTVLLLALGLGFSSVSAQETEQEMVDRFLDRTVAKHTHKLGWASVNFSMNRINRHNDYNDFTIAESSKLSNGEFAWLDQGFIVGADFGMVFKKRFAWSLGGEYWLKLGETLEENDTYLQLSTMTSVPSNPKSEIQVFGITTSLSYYFYNPPQAVTKLTGLSARLVGSVGYYMANWDLWTEYENLNLSTAAPVDANTTFKGTAPGFSLGLGMDYPLGFLDMGLGLDMSYLHLNFANIAWYNTDGEEIVVSLNGTEEHRVDLGLSGFRGRVELKRYFNW